jgi:hypothetical protein
MERQKWTMEELNAWDAEGFTEEQIMAICKEIYPVGEVVNYSYNAYVAQLEPQIWRGDPFKLLVTTGAGLCYDIEQEPGFRFQRPYYM